MEVSGTRSSWLTIPRNSARSLSASSKCVMSCSVTTTDSAPMSKSSEYMGVVLISALTERPSGMISDISSARTVSADLMIWAMGSSARDISRPSARRMIIRRMKSCASSMDWCRTPPIRFASRLAITISPVLASKTSTPTGEVFTRVSSPALVRCSSRYRRALVMTSAAWAANITKVSSSSSPNSDSP